MRKKVLFITPAIYANTSSGGLHVSLERLTSLAKIADVTVLTLATDDAAKNRFRDVQWITAGELRARGVLNLLRSYMEGLPLSVWRNTSSALIEKAKEINSQEFDIAYIDHWLIGEAALVSAAKYKVLHLHNAEPEIFERASRNASMLAGIVLRREARRCAAYLRNLQSHVDEIHLLSEDDKICLAGRGVNHPRTHIFLPSVDSQGVHPRPFSERDHSTLFVGTLSWHANQEGLHWYARSVLPHISNAIRLDVVGGGADKALQNELTSHTQVNMHGYVSDIESYYSRSKCLVAPLLSGSGIKIKILHALAKGLPVITTTTGIEGFPSGYEGAVHVSDDPVEFAKIVRNVLEDEELWMAASLAAQKYCRKHFSGIAWENWVKNGPASNQYGT